MRKWVIGLAALSFGTLSACESDVPSPADRLNGETADAIALEPGLVTLRSDGLTAGPESFFFAAGQVEVTTALSRSLGAAGDTSEMAECGAGPMESTSFPGGLTVNFQVGYLVGWFVDGGAENISVDGDVALGMPRNDAEAVSGYSVIQDSTLGEEFNISGELAGFIEGDAVSTLYAGTQCFFR